MLFCPQGACSVLQETWLTEKGEVLTTNKYRSGVNECREKVRPCLKSSGKQRCPVGLKKITCSCHDYHSDKEFKSIHMALKQ